MKKIYMLGFTYDDFAGVGFVATFITQDKNKAIELLKKEKLNNHEVREYLIDAKIEHDDFERVAFTNAGEFFVQTVINKNRIKAKVLIKNFIKGKDFDDVHDDEWEVLNDKLKEMDLPVYIIDRLFEEIF